MRGSYARVGATVGGCGSGAVEGVVACAVCHVSCVMPLSCACSGAVEGVVPCVVCHVSCVMRRVRAVVQWKGRFQPDSWVGRAAIVALWGGWKPNTVFTSNFVYSALQTLL